MVFTQLTVVQTKITWGRGVGFVFLIITQYFSNRIIYLMTKNSVHWNSYRLAWKPARNVFQTCTKIYKENFDKNFRIQNVFLW